MDFFKNGTMFSVEVHNGESLVVNRHLHSVYEFYYLCSGEIGYFTENGVCPVEKGDLVIVPPNTIHTSVKTKESKRKRILFYIDKDFLPLCTDENLWPKHGIFHINSHKKLTDLISTIVDEYENENNQLMLKALLYEFLVHLSRLALPEKSTSSDTISKVLHYINSEYTSDITLDNTAKKFFINPSYLSRLFKEKTGVNFLEYINKYRVKKAIELLLETNYTVTEIAAKTGFNSTNNFCKKFKSILGCSPLEYRNQR